LTEVRSCGWVLGVWIESMVLTKVENSTSEFTPGQQERMFTQYLTYRRRWERSRQLGENWVASVYIGSLW